MGFLHIRYMITSFSNSAAKRLRGLKNKKMRDAEGSYIIEGPKLLDEAFFSGVRIKSVFFSPYGRDRFSPLIERAEAAGIDIMEFSDDVFSSLCDTVTAQGIACEAAIPEKKRLTDIDFDYALLLDGVSDPGNMGTILRTAAASGVRAVFCSAGCADVYSPKVIRSAAGAAFRLDIYEGTALTEVLSSLHAAGFTSLAAVLGGEDYFSCGFAPDKVALIIGNEAHGISPDTAAAASHRVELPMRGDMESLNAAMAAGILLYDIFRKREGI